MASCSHTGFMTSAGFLSICLALMKNILTSSHVMASVGLSETRLGALLYVGYSLEYLSWTMASKDYILIEKHHTNFTLMFVQVSMLNFDFTSDSVIHILCKVILPMDVEYYALSAMKTGKLVRRGDREKKIYVTGII